MKVEINGVVYTVEARGRAQAVKKAAEIMANSPAKTPVFVGYEKHGVVYRIDVAGQTVLAIVRNAGEV